MAWLKFLMIAVALAFLALGISLPIMRFDSFYFFTDTPSLIGIVASLWDGGDVVLALVVGLFSIVFPLVKLAVHAAGALPDTGRKSGAGRRGGRRPNGLRHAVRQSLPHLSKWSMMDVMLVAIVIFAAKTSGLASAVAQPGLWFYAGSTLVSGILMPLADRALKRGT